LEGSLGEQRGDSSVEIKRLKARLDEQEQLLTHFLSRASHDLRGPARRIHMLVSMIQDPGLPDADRAKILGFLSDTAVNLKEMVEGFSALHGARSRPLRVSPDCSVQSCAQAALEGRTIAVQGLEDLPVVLADPNALVECFSALIDNASLWSGQGDALQLRFTAEALDGGWAIGVLDNGIGLSDPQQLSRAMLPFERMTSEGAEHVGLGLSLVATLADRMGGRAWAEQGPGLHVRLWLPGSGSLQAT
jgi:signal transduction histidine kinase